MVLPMSKNQSIYFIGGYDEYYICIKRDDDYLMSILINYGCEIQTINFALLKHKHDECEMPTLPNNINKKHALIKISNTGINKMMMETNIFNYYNVIKYISEYEQYKFTKNDRHLITLNCIGIGIIFKNINHLNIKNEIEKLIINNNKMAEGIINKKQTKKNQNNVNNVVYRKTDIRKYFTKQVKNESEANETCSLHDNEIIIYITI